MNENKSRRKLHLFACMYMLNSNTLTQIKGLMDTYRMPPPPPPRFSPLPISAIMALIWHNADMS